MYKIYKKRYIFYIMKTVIIIPYRNRESHLMYYLNKSLPELKKVIDNLEVVVVEQEEGKKFNRGKIINVGYKYYGNKDNYYITQDVDVNPCNKDTIQMYNEKVKEDEFVGIYSDGGTLGGVVKFTGKTFEKVNGFPNNYWGWGHEDKDLSNRAEYYDCHIRRIIKFDEYKKKAEYFKIFEDNHNRQDCGLWSIPYRLWKTTSYENKEKYIKSNGLSSCNYKILKKEQLMEGVVKIVVEI